MKRVFSILLLIPLIAGFAPLSSPTDKGNEAYRAGKYDDALEAYRKAVDEDPKGAVPHYNLGNAYYKKGDFDNALTEYRYALTFDPKMAEAYYNAGDSLYRLGRYDEALKSYQEADSLKKGDADTDHNLKLTLKKVRQADKEKPKPPQGQQDKKSQGPGGREKKGTGSQKPGSTGQGQEQGQPQPGQPGMSNEEVQAILDRQAKEEKKLRNFFRPGKKDDQGGRESEIEQMLRGFGLKGVAPLQVRPGAPCVEKDW